MAFASSIHTAAVSSIAEDLNCSGTVAILGVSTYLIGFGTGPLIFAPLSEICGRNSIYRVTFLLFFLFNLGCALSPNIGALLTLRFLSGFFGSPAGMIASVTYICDSLSSPSDRTLAVTNSGGSLTDLWPPTHRSIPLALFTAASFLGPVLAPIVGGFLTQYASWRW
jgi:MFS family permease